MGKIKEQPIILLKTFLIFAYFYMYNVFHSLSPVQLFAVPWTEACQTSLSPSLPKFMSIALVNPSNYLILWLPYLLTSILTSIRNFSSELAVQIRRPKFWSFSFSISPSNDYLRLISLKIDCFDLLAVQVTFKSLLQHHSLKALILWCSAFFTVQLTTCMWPVGKS